MHLSQGKNAADTSTPIPGRKTQALMLWVFPFGSLAFVVIIGLIAWSTGSSNQTPLPDNPHAHHHAGSSSHNDFFTNYGSYMQRIGCLSTASGKPDWPWIFALIFLNLGIMIAYLRIYIFWTKSYLAEEKRDRNSKLMDLAQMFLWCSITGYAAGILMFVWPAYRLVAVCLLILNFWSWRFAFNLNSFRIAFSAVRYRRLASCDALTGLPNRMALIDDISRRLEKLPHDNNDKQTFAVLFMDFDRFKLVNDTLGHEAGDELLKAIATRLQTIFVNDPMLSKHYGLAGRIGGDEFVLVLEGISDNPYALDLAQIVVKHFKDPFDLDGRSVRSSPSIGVVAAWASYTSAEKLIRDADVAMYAAKKHERDAVALFDRAMLADVAERMELENDLHNAVERHELLLHYQPLIDLESGKIDGFEALVRWRHPTRGLIPPDRFIGIAEETGYIAMIGDWVLKEASLQLAYWSRQEIGRDWRIHVNVSTNQIYDSTLTDRFTSITKEAGVPNHRLVLEVTESTFITDIDATTKTLDALRDVGFQLAMDDFGTGYSSLSLLHLFPIQELKIDRAFILNMSDRPDYAAVIHAIVCLAENFKIQVVGEGIETPEQLAELQALGCNYAQGYYFSKPMPADQVIDWARQWGQNRLSA